MAFNSNFKHRIFLPEKLGGLGFLLTVKVDIIAVLVREIKIALNRKGFNIKSMCCRTKAIYSYKDHMRKTYIPLLVMGTYGSHRPFFQCFISNQEEMRIY